MGEKDSLREYKGIEKEQAVGGENERNGVSYRGYGAERVK